MPSLEPTNEVSSTGHVSKKLKSKFTKAWLSFLKLPLPLDVYKEVLFTLHQNVMPYMAKPAILCDFLTRSYGIGGVISVMALSGLFTLMTQYGLEYPKFYEKLYALLTPAVFMAKHWAVFFQLVDTCLKSSYLPAYFAAGFAKKFSRLALSVPPQGALVIIAITHNLLRRHPSISFLVHQEVGDEIDGDAFMGGDELSKDAREPNAGAVMHSKKQSIDPSTKRVTRLSPMPCMRRRIKQVPLAFYKVTPTSLFWESDSGGWAFGDPQNVTDAVIEGGVNSTAIVDDCEWIKRQRIKNS